MKNLIPTMFVLALASLICLFAPCNVLAQDDDDDSCCYNAPSAGNPLGNAGIQVQISLFEIAQSSIGLVNAQLLSNRATMPVIEESHRVLIYRRQS